MATDPFEQNVENPFTQLGISPAAVEALVSLNDPEALSVAVSGLQRTMSRALHPDAHQGNKTPKSEAFLLGVNDATNALRGASPDELMIFAKDFIRPSKRQGRARKTTETVTANKDYSFQIIQGLAQASFGSLGVTADPNSRLFVHRYASFAQEEAYWLTLQRDGIDNYHITPYRQESLLPSTTSKQAKQDLELLQQRVMPFIPTTEVLPIHNEDNDMRGKLLSNTLEVDQSGQPILYDLLHRHADVDLSTLRKSNVLGNPGIYKLHTKFSEEDPVVPKTTISPYYYAPATSGYQNSVDMRLIGSVDRRFENVYKAALDLHNRTSSATPSGPRPSIGYGSTPVQKIWTNNQLGQKIPDRMYNKLGESFSPQIEIGRLLLIATDGDIRLPGELVAIYQ